MSAQAEADRVWLQAASALVFYEQCRDNGGDRQRWESWLRLMRIIQRVKSLREEATRE